MIVFQPAHALSDSTIQLSAKKAAELNLKQNDIVVVIGRRRHATYGMVQITGGKSTAKTVCGISPNLAANLRLRQDDKLKVEPLHTNESSETEADARSGDLVLIQSAPRPMASVTFSPLEDSLEHLVKLEGGDSIPDEELQARFIVPYLEGAEQGALLKQDHLLTLTDENGQQLEWYVSHVELEGEESDTSDATAEQDGTYKMKIV